jgi:hypothetical protein
MFSLSRTTEALIQKHVNGSKVVDVKNGDIA